MTLPPDFTKYTRALMGHTLYRQFEQAMNHEPTAFIRLNRLKCPDAEPCVPAEPVAWYRHGYALTGRPAFTFDPLLHAGLYYVQESSSMFLAAVLRQHVRRPVRMLDMCAAPGGKATLARLELPEGSTLMCNDPVGSRAQILTENVQKCGPPEVIVTNNYPADYRRAGLKFDIILCDVPCSGEGMFRKNPNAVGEWSVENVENCRRLQRDIVTDAWACLEDGGLLIYSTCTFNTRENEENIDWICRETGATLLPVDVDPEWNIAGSLLPSLQEPVYRFIPGYRYADGKRYGEGLFMAVLRKPGNPSAEPRKNTTEKILRPFSPTEASVADWLKQPERFGLVAVNQTLMAVPRSMAAQFDKAEKQLRILSAGICLGRQKGRTLIPHHALALSTHLAAEAFPTISLTYPQAIGYLRRETDALPKETPLGFVVVTYQGIPLGFVKNIGNRANNLYPAEWRIKSSHTPETETRIINITQ